MKRIILSPFSRPLRNGKRNPKNYPYWESVISILQRKKIHVIQIGVTGEEKLNANEFAFDKSLKELEELVNECKTWSSVDNFFQHFCYLLGKPGVVVFGRSDPKIFGHELNDNLIKNRSYLREKQFNFWEQVDYSEECFVDPILVVDTILRRVSNGN